MVSFLFRSFTGGGELYIRLTRHFETARLSEIVTATREFPAMSRVDIQAALDDWFRARTGVELLGIHTQMDHETSTLARLFTGGPLGAELGPLQHDEIDIGNEKPVRCLKNGLWLARNGVLPFAVFVAPSMKFGQSLGVHVEIGVPSGESGAAFSQEFFRDLEVRVAAGKTYRGRVISLESHQNYSGRGGSVRVHRLHSVSREDVILPQKTLSLLDRNVSKFVAARDEIRALRFSTKKGLLFYGPPGTGKTHTIHYLASQLPRHTTLLVTAEQVGLLGEYFRLARFLQPAMMVVEDVDLIARQREHMRDPVEEVLLNKLLNEMDGLREDADVLFILTTNRPDQLEPALASRPGRIDQAIEFPLPDDEGRAKLVRLYSRELDVPADLMELIVRRSKGSSPAFIKELMRRSAQFLLEMGGGRQLTTPAVDAAIEEMVFTGGSLNLKLLGGETTEIARAVGGQS